MDIEAYLGPLDFMPARWELSIPKWAVDEPLIGWYSSVGLGKEGCQGHYRKGRYHAWDIGDRYDIHVDLVDPLADPIGHLKHDAPHLLEPVLNAVAITAVVASFIVLFYALSRGG